MPAESLIYRGEPSSYPDIDFNRAITWVQESNKLQLAASQTEAIRCALENRVVIITGGPGVGKTTIIQSILKILHAKCVTFALCAPTGRAAKRLSESTGHEARTIHRLLEVNPRNGQFKHDEESPLEEKLLVVDECSMVDIPLMHHLLKALPEDGHLLLVGDVDQLPSVGSRFRVERFHSIRMPLCCAAAGNISAGSGQQDHHECTSNQSGADANDGRGCPTQ